jgi:hypothetical protein
LLFVEQREPERGVRSEAHPIAVTELFITFTDAGPVPAAKLPVGRVESFEHVVRADGHDLRVLARGLTSSKAVR